jgi:hypothetical protein
VNDIVTVPILDPIYSDFVGGVEKIAQDIAEKKDFERGFQIISGMLEYVKAVDDGVGLVINAMSSKWEPDEHEGESFEQAIERRTGIKPITVQRHLKIQKALPSVPDAYRDEIQDKGFKAKIRVAQLVEGGYEVTDEDWRDIAEAPDEKEVDRISRKIRGVEPRSNWLALSIDKQGILNVHTVRGVRQVGRLDVHDDDPDVKKAISRLLGCTGVQPATEY